jgi:hypothetical protein
MSIKLAVKNFRRFIGFDFEETKVVIFRNMNGMILMRGRRLSEVDWCVPGFS